MIIIYIFVFIRVLSLSQSQKLFMPNLPLGAYRTVFEKIYPCDSTANYSLQCNFYFDKKTLRTTELKGNITLFRPFDDNFTFDVNFSSWGSTGGWIPNAYIYIAPKACKTLKNLGGDAWFKAAKAYNFSTFDCPLPVGTYTTSGIDVKTFENHNFPKVYFYGKYKLVFKVKNKENKVHGCEVVEVNLIRPWETPI